MKNKGLKGFKTFLRLEETKSILSELIDKETDIEELREICKETMSAVLEGIYKENPKALYGILDKAKILKSELEK